jgi:CBS domain containing-hemolysin-like protein
LAELGYNEAIEIFDESSDLLSACKALGTMNTHRILVGEDGTLVNFITQSAVVRLLANNTEKFARSASRTLADCHLNITSDLITVPRSTKAIDAFKLMRDKVCGAMMLCVYTKLTGCCRV